MTKYRITVEEIETSGESETRAADTFAAIRRYEQTTDALDLKAVIAAINKKPRAPRTKKAPAGGQTSQ